MFNKIVVWICTGIGMLTVIGVLVGIIWNMLVCIKEFVQERNYELLKERWLHSLADVSRYCYNEFPQIDFMANKIMKNLHRGTTLRGNEFREELRNKFDNKEKT